MDILFTTILSHILSLSTNELLIIIPINILLYYQLFWKNKRTIKIHHYLNPIHAINGCIFEDFLYSRLLCLSFVSILNLEDSEETLNAIKWLTHESHCKSEMRDTHTTSPQHLRRLFNYSVLSTTLTNHLIDLFIYNYN